METIGVLVSAAGIVVLRGWVLSVMWGWFAIPVFAAPPLPVAAAVGFGVITGLFAVRPSGADASGKTSGAVAHEVAATALTALTALGFGWVAHLFM